MFTSSAAFTFLSRTCIVLVELPLGVFVGIGTERLSRWGCYGTTGRRSHYARWRNAALKVAVTAVSVWLIVGLYPLDCASFLSVFAANDEKVCGARDEPVGAGDCPDPRGEKAGSVTAGEASYLVLRLLAFALGSAIGAALQPVGLTGGIATGKSTFSDLLSSTVLPGGGGEEKEKKSEKHRSTPEAKFDFVIIDVDGIAHDILLPEKLGRDSVYPRLLAEFGKGILVTNTEKEGSEHSEAKDGNKEIPSDNSSPPLIDRRKLGDVVFRNKQKRRILNSITHPTIIKIMIKRILYEGLDFRRFLGRSFGGANRRRVVCVDIPLLFEGGLHMRLLFGTTVVVACRPDLQLNRLTKRNSDLSTEQCRQRIASQIPVEEKARRADVVVRNDGGLEEFRDEVEKARGTIADCVAGAGRGVEFPRAVLYMGGLAVVTRLAAAR